MAKNTLNKIIACALLFAACFFISKHFSYSHKYKLYLNFGNLNSSEITALKRVIRNSDFMSKLSAFGKEKCNAQKFFLNTSTINTKDNNDYITFGFYSSPYCNPELLSDFIASKLKDSLDRPLMLSSQSSKTDSLGLYTFIKALFLSFILFYIFFLYKKV